MLKTGERRCRKGWVRMEEQREGGRLIIEGGVQEEEMWWDHQVPQCATNTTHPHPL